MTTPEQQHELGLMMVYTELWLSSWNKLVDSGYIPRNEIKFHGNNFKGTLEKLQKEMFNTMYQKMPKDEAQQAETQYLDRIEAIELLIGEFNKGNVRIEG
jgi:hypothetical protein